MPIAQSSRKLPPVEERLQVHSEGLGLVSFLSLKISALQHPGMPSAGCRICTAIGKAIVNPSDDEEIEVGTFGELQQNDESCLTCYSFLSGCSRDETEVLEPEALIILYLNTSPDSDMQICDEGHNSLYSEVAELQPHEPSRSAGIIVDEKWIDLQRVQAWLSFCDDSHQNTCHGFPDQEGVRPADNLLLIDVKEERLVSASGTARYFALSYV